MRFSPVVLCLILAVALPSPAFSQTKPHPMQAEFAKAAAGTSSKPGDTVNFTFKQSYLTKTALDVVTRQAAWLKAHPAVKVRLECHTDDDLEPMDALSYGDTRCREVEKYLMKNGVSAARITALSLGNQRPVVKDAKTQEERAQNRRVVTVLVGQ